MPSTKTRPPKLNGFQVARELLFDGLSIDGQIVQGATGSDIVRWRTGRRVVFAISHPDYVDHVLHENADGYHKSIEYELLRTVLGLNLFTDEDESWRRHRMMLNPVMAKRHVRDMCDLMIDPIESFMSDLDDGSDEVEVDMTGAMTELTLDVVGAALFGHQFGDVARKMKSVVTAGLRSAEVATRLLMVVAPPVWMVRTAARAIHRAPYLPPPVNQAQWVMRTVDEAVWSLIEERRAHPSETGDLLNLLLSASDEKGALPLKRVRDEVTTFMLAGHETTANALSWMWYLLALNPEARDRMLDEVDDVATGQRLGFEDAGRMPWTTACFMEAMRMYPPAWAIPRIAVRPDVIDGYRIPKGATVIIPAHAIHHDERWWPDPERYDPERFMGENARSRHRSAYLPFGGGRRVCIGSSFALTEATLITATMSREFTYDVKPGHRVEPEATLTLRPRYGLKMLARRRSPALQERLAA